ncbi:hypothetical protein FGK63_14235 [Ruegeria sediminis]|uniref:Uncharacterized protein n=1 Tax=Ruegeria sediminis TaxID=2583820 RepID=A0ABY2WUN6_9RHOB|nr:hypothetical protein [Ruegeria sediminis]TMV06313.1 hypothetical protein FGK63_14235 [Ruegeria sediminis]
MTYFTVRSDDLKSTLVCSVNSMWRWLRHIERERDWNVNGARTGSTPDRFRLTDLVVALRQNRRRGLSGDELRAVVALDTSKTDPSAPLGHDADARAAALIESFSGEERERYARVSEQAAKAATQALWGKGHLYNGGRCLGLLPLRPEILAYSMTGQRRDGFPDHTERQWGAYITQHVMATVTADELINLAS